MSYREEHHINTFKDLITHIITQEAIRQKRLADLIGCSAGTVSEWINNNRFPNASTHSDIADALTKLNPEYTEVFWELCQDNENAENHPHITSKYSTKMYPGSNNPELEKWMDETAPKLKKLLPEAIWNDFRYPDKSTKTFVFHICSCGDTREMLFTLAESLELDEFLINMGYVDDDYTRIRTIMLEKGCSFGVAEEYSRKARMLYEKLLSSGIQLGDILLAKIVADKYDVSMDPWSKLLFLFGIASAEWADGTLVCKGFTKEEEESAAVSEAGLHDFLKNMVTNKIEYLLKSNKVIDSLFQNEVIDCVGLSLYIQQFLQQAYYEKDLYTHYYSPELGEKIGKGIAVITPLQISSEDISDAEYYAIVGNSEFEILSARGLHIASGEIILNAFNNCLLNYEELYYEGDGHFKVKIGYDRYTEELCKRIYDDGRVAPVPELVEIRRSFSPSI